MVETREQKAAIEKVKELTSTASPTPVVLGSTGSVVEGGDPSGRDVEGADVGGVYHYCV